MKRTWLLTLIAFSLSTPIHARDAAEYGRVIAQEYEQRDSGFGNYEADLKMTLINSAGQQTLRYMRTKIRESSYDGEGERRLIIFDRPRDVRGTVLLTATQKQKVDDQWIFLPAVKRTKRISSNSRTGPFMGSEFAYEDLGSPETDKYIYKYIGEDGCADNLTCFKVTRYPKDKYTGYKKQIVWIDTQAYRLWKVEFYDRKDTLLKTLHVEGYQQYEGKYWRAQTMTMNNRQTKKSTTLTWDNYQFNTSIDDREFLASNINRLVR